MEVDFEQRFAVQHTDTEGLRLKAQDINVGRCITVSEILDSIVDIQKSLNAEHLAINTQHFLVNSVIVHEKNALVVKDSDFLNSFFVKDLSKIAVTAAKGRLNDALSRYLEQDVCEKSRIDLRQLNNKENLACLSPSIYPRGCWPSKDFFPLVYAQQFAVNTIMETVGKKTGIFSINGPPGTGKTTLLRDLIAAVIVERAVKIAQLSHPSAAFEGDASWISDSKNRSVAIWKEDFYGHEIVVASSNNSAVENVTLEVPALDAIDVSYLQKVDYFSDIATEMLDKDCWAFLAAKLGNKNNRTSFKNKFWAYPEFAPKSENVNDPKPKKPSFYKFLLDCKPTTSWKESVNKFRSALEREEVVRQERQSLYEKYKTVTENENDFAILIINIAQSESDLAACYQEFKTMELSLENAKRNRERFIEQRLQHRQFKPGIIEIIFSIGKVYTLWHKQDLEYQKNIQRSESQINDIVLAMTAYQNSIQERKNVLSRLSETKETWLRHKADIETGKGKLGKYFPDILLLQDDIARELSSPWMDEVWFQARVNVFLEALNLQRVFIEANAEIFRKNLHSMMDVLSGKGQHGMPVNVARSVWATFFFVVPVVSTTFASYDRLFPQLEQETLGWLFIDEAGQATPQAAVGALWRAKRAVVVGDPLQLEPILTIPITAQEALRKHFSVSDNWLPKFCSVQTLSDRVNPYGTYLKNENAEDFWVGAPLRVHRRCDNPMFNISNAIAYDGMMVFGTPLRQALLIESSCWFHVEGRAGTGHWIEAEGIVVQQLIDKLLQRNIGAESIAIISPFTTVVKQLKYHFYRGKSKPKIGTIHTMQGKEADVVILVLGGDPNKAGVKDWASEKPNLLNVAVSRAKKRLYVVGDRQSWEARPYFCQLSQLLNRGSLD